MALPRWQRIDVDQSSSIKSPPSQSEARISHRLNTRYHGPYASLNALQRLKRMGSEPPSAPQKESSIRYHLNVGCRRWPTLIAHLQRNSAIRPSWPMLNTIIMAVAADNRPLNGQQS